jgi:hypothetical protein
MRGLRRTRVAVRNGAIVGLWCLGLHAAGFPCEARGQWAGYGRNAQHTALAAGPSQLPLVIRWQTPVDADQQGGVVIHYGSPAITAANKIIVPVKTGTEPDVGFLVKGINAATGALIWTMTTDYVLPSHNWTPPMGLTLTPGDEEVVVPGAGGTILVRTNPNVAQNTNPTRIAFYGMQYYNQNPAAFNTAIHICTPITSDNAGNLYFGYLSSGDALPGYPQGIPSGLARVESSGAGGTFVAASALAGDNTIVKVAYNCAPAISTDGSKVYVAVNQGNFSYGYLCMANAENLRPQASVYLKDPRNGQAAAVSDDGTATPTIGTDGDVYYGVLEANFPSNHARGWMLHFSPTLSTTKIPGAFGWDDSPSVVPSVLVPAYKGHSTYLILTKYNNYADAGIGGNGLNMVAVLDPNASMVDPISGATVMNTVLTVLGPTENTGLPGVREWCINSAAVDIANKCAVINSEDGHVYRWSFTTNSLSEGLNLAPPTSEAYTSTLIGPDGAVYATNDANLFCCAASLNNSPTVTPGGGGGGTPPTGVPTVTPSPGNTPTPIAGTGITTTTTPSSGTTTTTTTKGPTPSTPEPAPPPGPAPKPTKPPKKPKKPKPKAKPKASAFLVIPKDSDKWAPKEDGLG